MSDSATTPQPEPKKTRSAKKQVTPQEVEKIIDDLQISALTKEVAHLYQDKAETRQREFQEHKDYIERQLSEFMRSFIVLGYDVHGDRMVLVHAKDELEKDALYTLLHKYLVRVNTPQPE